MPLNWSGMVSRKGQSGCAKNILSLESVQHVIYFCLNGFTTGSKKRKLVLHLKSGETIQTDKCVERAVDISKGSDYCKMCYRKQLGATRANGKPLSAQWKRRKCKSSRPGCSQPSCMEHICKLCWTEGYDKHKKI